MNWIVHPIHTKHFKEGGQMLHRPDVDLLGQMLVKMNATERVSDILGWDNPLSLFNLCSKCVITWSGPLLCRRNMTSYFSSNNTGTRFSMVINFR